MLIYRCDHCGTEHKEDQITGNEFKASKIGWVTLAIPYPNVKDVCPTCFEKVFQEVKAARSRKIEEERATEFAAMKKVFAAEKNPCPKCGKKQPMGDKCVECGLEFAK